MSVKILLREKGTNKPIQFVKIRIFNQTHDFEDETDAKGLADFTGQRIRDGKYTVKIRDKKYRPYTEKHYISRNSYIMDIKLHKAYD